MLNSFRLKIMKIVLDLGKANIDITSLLLLMSVRILGHLTCLTNYKHCFMIKKKHSKETGFIKANEFIITHAV